MEVPTATHAGHESPPYKVVEAAGVIQARGFSGLHRSAQSLRLCGFPLHLAAGESLAGGASGATLLAL